MTKLSRRAFLAGVSATTLAVLLPTPAHAAPSRTIVLEAVKGSNGIYNTVKVPSGIAAEIGLHRTQELERASNRALSIAQSQNLSRPKANGLLTRIWKPALKGNPKGVVTSLLELGLIAGLTWALTNAAADLSKDSSTLTMGGQACAATPVTPSSLWDRGTGIWKANANSSTALAVQRTTAATAGGTVPAPAGWSWAGQRTISTGLVEVQFTKQVACGERIAFPPTVPQGAVLGEDQVGQQTDQNSLTNRGKIVDGQHGAAVADQKAGAPIPGGEVTGEVEDGAVIPDAGTKGAPPTTDTETPYKPIDYTAPRNQIGNDDTHVKFPPEVPLPGTGTTTPGTDTGTTTPGTGSTPIDWGTPPEGAIPDAPAAFSWVPAPWAAPSLPGSCTGLPYDFSVVFRGASGSINPCPVINQARPVLRPVAVAGWTVYAVTQFLDL